MDKYFILPYKMTSKSSRKLARALECKRAYPDRRYRGRPNHTLINWGYSETPEVSTSNCREILNDFSAIPYVSNKLKFFEFPSTTQKVPHTTNIEDAKGWIENGHVAYCRTLLSSKGGKGIVVAKTIEELVHAPLYTLGITSEPKEYRVHVFKNVAIHIQQKKKMSSEKLEELGITHNADVKNHDNGWVFAINEMDTPNRDTIAAAENIMREYALDFGAVDIIQEFSGHPFVLEINTAPGLEGTTLDKYKETFSNYLESL